MELLKKYHKTNHPCKRIILDALAVRLPDDDDDDNDDNVCINVIVDLCSHHQRLYTHETHKAEALALTLSSYYMQRIRLNHI